MDYTKIYNDLKDIEQYIFTEIDEDLKIEFLKLMTIDNHDLSYNDIINKYAKIIYFWSHHMPDFGDIENGDINSTFKWLYIQNKIITTLRRIKKLNGNLMYNILDRYILLTLNIN